MLEEVSHSIMCIVVKLVLCHEAIPEEQGEADVRSRLQVLTSAPIQGHDGKTIKPCQRLSPSRIPVSYPIMKLFTVTSELVYLWDVPDRCQHSTAFQSFSCSCHGARCCHQIQKKHTFTKKINDGDQVKREIFLSLYNFRLSICQKG